MPINSTIVTPHRWPISTKIHPTPPPPILSSSRHIYFAFSVFVVVDPYRFKSHTVPEHLVAVADLSVSELVSDCLMKLMAKNEPTVLGLNLDPERSEPH